MTGAARRVLLSLALVCCGLQAAEPARRSAPLTRPYPSALRAYVPTAAETPEAPRRADADNEARRTLKRDNFYDALNPDVARLQRYEEAVAPLPRDANGFPDWMGALRSGQLAPRAAIGGGTAMDVLDLDVIMKNTKEMPYVRFPHKAHTLWLDCANCHPQPFEPRAGAARIAMADIFRGHYCGMCHDRVAFVTFMSCQRCHSVPQPVQQAGGQAR